MRSIGTVCYRVTRAVSRTLTLRKLRCLDTVQGSNLTETLLFKDSLSALGIGPVGVFLGTLTRRRRSTYQTPYLKGTQSQSTSLPTYNRVRFHCFSGLRSLLSLHTPSSDTRKGSLGHSKASRIGLLYTNRLFCDLFLGSTKVSVQLKTTRPHSVSVLVWNISTKLIADKTLASGHCHLRKTQEPTLPCLTV